MECIEKVILDACCGGRHMWIQKESDMAVFMDIRSVDKGIITMKYGNLGETWKEDLKKGFTEIMRVLKPHGVMNLKFNDLDISFKELLGLFPFLPQYGTPTKKGVNNTAYFIYVKPNSWSSWYFGGGYE